MKKSHLIIIATLIFSVSAAAQQRPRFFDNFDTARGVNVYRPEQPKVVQPLVQPSKNGKKGKNSRNNSLVVKTGQANASTGKPLMDPPNALAKREAPRSAEVTRLIMAAGSGMKGFTTGDSVIDAYIVDSSRRYNIDPLLIYAQMHQESSFKLRATSYKGASGLMQLMPATARRLGVTNIYEPKQNIEGGVKYMRMLLNMFGQDVNLALAGYNAGEGAVMKYGNSIPPYAETREYVRRISARYSSITNPSYVRTAKRVNNATAAKLEQKEARPLAVYEPNPIAIRLADGRMRLVNQ
ncbi:MAG: lytic transglycosylase domain-containing protein [Pyrinomonadaceae bacterium]|nr:lytic transglycosylase domain-containing protein [Pyrinomonadaceae bacterium]MBP6213691.1 lytic transglycosylase domain-containing protein [Pyrinomonadaceae bacterium]